MDWRPYNEGRIHVAHSPHGTYSITQRKFITPKFRKTESGIVNIQDEDYSIAFNGRKFGHSTTFELAKKEAEVHLGNFSKSPPSVRGRGLWISSEHPPTPIDANSDGDVLWGVRMKSGYAQDPLPWDLTNHNYTHWTYMPSLSQLTEKKENENDLNKSE